jgi:hypothetical protein
MISRRNASLLLGLLLVLALGLKIPGSLSGTATAYGSVVDTTVEFLKRNGFDTDQHISDVDMFSISAKTGECRVLVAILSPHGWHREVVKKIAPQGSEVQFLYNGEIYDDQPVLRTRFDDYWYRFLRQAGGTSVQQPVFGIAETSECAVRNIPWARLSQAFS